MPLRRFGYTIYRLTGGHASKAAFLFTETAIRAERAPESPQPVEGGAQLENSRYWLHRVHDPARCAGRPCALHNRSEHHMRAWPQTYRWDRGLIERTCPHGVGHPDPDHMAYLDERVMNGQMDPDHAWGEGIHGCDGCCNPLGPAAA